MQIKVKASSSRKCHNFSNSFSTRLIFLSLSDTLILPREALSWLPYSTDYYFHDFAFVYVMTNIEVTNMKNTAGKSARKPFHNKLDDFLEIPQRGPGLARPEGVGGGRVISDKKKYVADLLCSKRICWSLDTYKTWL